MSPPILYKRISWLTILLSEFHLEFKAQKSVIFWFTAP